jgi:glucosamine--fructose-6-phosphate aminotransferase (isomerizing)
MKSLMSQEIQEQSTKLHESILINQEVIDRIGYLVRMRQIQYIIYAARGSSDNAGVYFKYLCEVVSGIPVAFAAPSVLTLYHGQLKMNHSLVIGVSQSGKAKDVLSILERAKLQGALTVSLTNDDQSPLAKAAEFHLDLHMGVEKSVAATKTFTAQMYLLANLAASIADNSILKEELKLVPSLVKETYACEQAIQVVASEYESIQDCFVLGRGFAYAIADEFALKLQETCYLKAMSFATSDFYHGPFALVNKDAHFFIMAPDDASITNSQEMIAQLEKSNASCTVFTNSASLQASSKIMLPTSPRSISVFTLIIAAQLFAMHLSLLKGLNPDQPRGLNKVTITI